MLKHSYKEMAIAVLAAAALAGCASAPTPKSSGTNDATAQAIQAAQAAIAGAQAPCSDTANAADILKQANAAASKGDNTKAQKLADRAKQVANQSINNCYLDLARQQLAEAQEHTNLNNDQTQQLNQGQQAINNSEGERAYNILSQLNAELNGASTTYNVKRGDTLWGIAGQSDVYGNSLEWPLIYKANSSQIKDADLIFPNQAFSVPTYPTHSAVDAAVNHAKNRGAWKVGSVEQSDRNYLQEAGSEY